MARPMHECLESRRHQDQGDAIGPKTHGVDSGGPRDRAIPDSDLRPHTVNTRHTLVHAHGVVSRSNDWIGQ
jgi:hypothetical protein